MQQTSEEDYAYPGKYLGSEEEFMPGEGTYTKDGGIYSSVFGKIKIDNRKIIVEQNKALYDFMVGQKVIGRIEAIIEPIAIVKVINLKDNKPYRISDSGQNYILRVQNIKKGFVNKVRDAYKIGDIIKAKVIELKYGEYQLSTVDEDCGVIKAYNSAYDEPRNPLKRLGDQLIDIKTNRKEIRKISNEYLINI
jgi:exosome complex component CSL4